MVKRQKDFGYSSVGSAPDRKIKPDEFEVGDKVWCVVFGEGAVTEVDSDDDYALCVYFGAVDGYEYYTKDGRLKQVGNRCLFFSKPTVSGSLTRQPLDEPGQINESTPLESVCPFTQESIFASDKGLQDYFAGQALAHPYTHDTSSPNKIAGYAYELADAMLEARKSK